MKPLGTLVLTLALACTTAFGQAQTESKFTATDAASGDQFGLGVALSGDTAIIGSYADDDAGPGSGSAYIFSKVGQSWIQQAKLTASDGAAGDNFGLRVTIDGGTVIAGSPLDDDNGIDSGSAYVYTGSGSSWTEQAKLKPGDGGMVDAGSAYIFVREGSVWFQQAKLTASDAAAGDFFGNSAYIDGNTVVIGANKDDHSGLVDAGSVYIFVRNGATWTEQAKLIASDAAVGDRFGRSVGFRRWGPRSHWSHPR